VNIYYIEPTIYPLTINDYFSDIFNL